MPYYLGIANTCHDPAVAVIDPSGEVLFAEALERYFQKKRAWDLPPDHAGRIMEIIETYCDPHDEFIIATPWKTPGLTGQQPEQPNTVDIQKQPQPGSLFRESNNQWLAWSQARAFEGCGNHLKHMFRHYYGNKNISLRQYDHHLAHAAMACYSSPFENALCLIADGEGEVGSVSSFSYKSGKLKRIQRSWGPGSPGSFYAKITELCGFDWRKGDEGKVMGLAAYGRPQDKLQKLLKKLIRTEECRVYFGEEPELGQILNDLEKLVEDDMPGGDAFRKDLANNGQYVFELVMSQLLKPLYDQGDSDNLVLGGGCGLNSSFNGKIIEKTPFSSVHVPCAPGDDGNGLGAAFLAFLEDNPQRNSKHLSWQSPYLGSTIAPGTLDRFTRFFPEKNLSHHPGTIHLETAKLISEGNIVGWIQGRAEYGPRSLGNRSILADPRCKDMKDRINRQVKFREDFRPLAPSVLYEAMGDWFECPVESPYMSFTLPWKASVVDRVPAVVHEDGTGRLQSVRRESNPMYYDLIDAFYKRTGVPVLLNTSLNIMGKPIIHSLEDGLGVLYTTGIDALVIGDYLIEKRKG